MSKLLVAVLFTALSAMAAGPAAKVRIMLLDGESGGPYHAWQLTTPVMKAELEETGLFQVDVVTAPPAGGDFSSFHPDFASYKAIVWNYDAPDERWSDEVKASFEKYVTGGGGVVIVHAADNAFPSWKAFNEMIGIGGWRRRNENAGPYWFFRDGKLTSDNSPGNAGAHGRRLPYVVTFRDTTHPVAKGLPATWMHQGDELYCKMRGPGKNMKVIATAMADKANAGTGNDEPILMVLEYGKGRIFHTVLGHDVNALSCVGFMTTFQRGTEWAATGKVTQKVPSNFPTAKSVSYRVDLAAMDPKFNNGLNPLDAAPRR